jgi:hypothetical protein
MADQIYRHPQPSGKEEHGHDEACEFTNNMGESCHCSDKTSTSRGLPAPTRYDVINAMKFAGWEKTEKQEESWHQQHGPHFIQLSRVKSGWALRWDKQGGMTFMERSGFGTITDAVNYFGGWVAERVDESNHYSWEHMAMTQQLKDVGIEPRRLGVKPSPRPPDVPGPLKHEVTAIMDEKGGS